MNKVPATIAAALMTVAGGCTSMANTELAPAVMTQSSPKAMDELSQTVSKALGGRPVRLAANSLMSNNRLIIERAPIYRDGNPVMGRSYEKPDHFYLMIDGDDCMLLHEQTGERYRLYKMKCAPMSAPGYWPQ